MNWARGGSFTEVIPNVPDFNSLTKREIVEWVEDKYGVRLSMRKDKAQLVKEAEIRVLETLTLA